jgi:hypothetical protein
MAKNHVQEENKLLRQVLEKARRYRGVEGYACPLCIYKNGKFVQPCAMHIQINALRDIVGLLRDKLPDGSPLHEKVKKIFEKMVDDTNRLYP